MSPDAAPKPKPPLSTPPAPSQFWLPAPPAPRVPKKRSGLSTTRLAVSRPALPPPPPRGPLPPLPPDTLMSAEPVPTTRRAVDLDRAARPAAAARRVARAARVRAGAAAREDLAGRPEVDVARGGDPDRAAAATARDAADEAVAAGRADVLERAAGGRRVGRAAAGLAEAAATAARARVPAAAAGAARARARGHVARARRGDRPVDDDLLGVDVQPPVAGRARHRVAVLEVDEAGRRAGHLTVVVEVLIADGHRHAGVDRELARLDRAAAHGARGDRDVLALGGRVGDRRRRAGRVVAVGAGAVLDPARRR